MTLMQFLDYFGTMFFAISGTLSAADKRLDMFGAAVIGFVTAVGGGTLRDLLIGDRPVGWLQTPYYFYVLLLGVIIAFLFQRYLVGMRRTFFMFDTIGIALFTIIGMEKALNFGIFPPLALMMGVTSAVVGGVIRDTLINEVPLIFHQELYATACIAGAVVFLLLEAYTPLPKQVIVFSTAGVIIVIRLFAIYFNIQLPKMKPNGDR